MDTTLVFNPVFTPSIVAILATSSVLVAAIWQRSTILATLSKIRTKLFTRSGFFWTVICCFMAVSVWQGGAFFAVSGDIVGYAVALFLDLVTVVLMHAQLESRYRGEHIRANLFIMFIILTCSMSTYANLAMSTNTFNAALMLPNSPQWIQFIAPYALASSPLFVIMLSIASEMIINVRPLNQLDEGTFDSDESKRVRILEIRNKHAIRQAEIEAEKEAKLQQLKIQRAGQRAIHKAAMTQIKSRKNTQAPAPAQPQAPAPQPQAVSEQNTDELKSADIQAALTENEQETASRQPEMIEEPKRNCEWYRSQGQINLTVQEAASLCGTSEQVIRSLCTKEKLKHPSPNSQLITLASIETYLHNRKQSTRKLKQVTASQPVIESNDMADIDRLLASASTPKYHTNPIPVASNGHSKETVKLDEYAEVLMAQ